MKYKFNGDGACVPGLPLEISEEEASLFNQAQAQVLKDALASGVYVEVGEPKSKPASRKQKAELGSEGEQP